jgi:hypothetical protein
MKWGERAGLHKILRGANRKLPTPKMALRSACVISNDLHPGTIYKYFSICAISILSNSGISSDNLAAATIGNQRLYSSLPPGQS